MVSRSDIRWSDTVRLRVTRVARAQDGPISRRQLRDCGLSAAAIDKRVARDLLFAVHPGVYKLTPEPLGRRGELVAVVLALPCPGLLSDGTATELWGIEDQSDPICVTVQRHRRLKVRGARVYRRTVHPADRGRCDGLPVTSVPRTLIDIAPCGRRRLRRAFEEAVRLERISERVMRAACARAGGRPGIGLVRELVDEWAAPQPTKSDLERDFLHLCRVRELPMPSVNVTIAGWEVDAFWSDARLAIELDSYAFHGRDRFQFDRDRRKGLALAAAGVELIRVGGDDLSARPATTADAIRVRLERGAR